MTRSHRRVLGLTLLSTSFLGIAVFAVVASFYRFSHITLTETELCLWSLGYWYCWVPFLVMAAVGYWLLLTSEELK